MVPPHRTIFVIFTPIQSCVTSWRISHFQNICLQNNSTKNQLFNKLKWKLGWWFISRVGRREYLMIFKLTNVQYCMEIYNLIQILVYICNWGDNKEFISWVVSPFFCGGCSFIWWITEIEITSFSFPWWGDIFFCTNFIPIMVNIFNAAVELSERNFFFYLSASRFQQPWYIIRYAS